MSRIKIPKFVSYQELGHQPDGNSAGFCTAYTHADVLNSPYEKSCVVFGHDIDKSAALVLVDRLNGFLSNCADSKFDYLEKQRKK